MNLEGFVSAPAAQESNTSASLWWSRASRNGQKVTIALLGKVVR